MKKKNINNKLNNIKKNVMNTIFIYPLPFLLIF